MEATDDPAFDRALRAMANPYRRQLLVALLDHNPQDDDDLDPLDITSGAGEPKVLKIELVHNHLPLLEELGCIAWDRDTNEISKGPRWTEVAPLIELIHDHREELPQGWL